MGKTKIKTIDDSIIEEPTKKVSSPKPKKEEDSLIARLNAELGITEERARGDSEEAGPRATEVKAKKIQKPGKATRPSSGRKPRSEQSSRVRSKKYQEVAKDLDRSITYPLTDAIDKVKSLSYAKFNGTLEAHINTAQTGVRGSVLLPFATGRKLRILAFGSVAPEIAGVIFGDDSTISEIEKGQVNFDLILTTPDWMVKLAKLARILGPKGLMPNPKNGTITTDIKKAIENFKAQTEYKTETKVPVIHLGLGKLNQPTEELEANVKACIQSIGKSRIKQVKLAPTMGPSVKLDLSAI